MGTIDNKLFVIIRNYVWKFDSSFHLSDNFPQQVKKVFPNLPQRFTKIDAFYQLKDNRDEIMIFSGDEYITYDRRGPIFMSYNLTRYTHDPDIEKIDAAMIWRKE
jgi:hypothetical protein